jgi:hypothetical protein
VEWLRKNGILANFWRQSLPPVAWNILANTYRLARHNITVVYLSLMISPSVTVEVSTNDMQTQRLLHMVFTGTQPPMPATFCGQDCPAPCLPLRNKWKSHRHPHFHPCRVFSIMRPGDHRRRVVKDQWQLIPPFCRGRAKVDPASVVQLGRATTNITECEEFSRQRNGQICHWYQ